MYPLNDKSGKRLLNIHCRPGTTDENAIKEVIERACYRKKSIGWEVLPGESWLDLGANIGAFALYCALRGVAAYDGYEPDPDCFKLLTKNLHPFRNKIRTYLVQSAVTAHTQPQLPFCKGSKDTDHYRTTIFHTRTPHPSGMLPNLHASAVFNEDVRPVVSPRDKSLGVKSGSKVKVQKAYWDGCKMDIEGAELELIDSRLIPKCNKLVLEYHFSRDKSMTNFHRRMTILKKYFKVVNYPPGLNRSYPNDLFPGFFDRLVFCKDWK